MTALSHSYSSISMFEKCPLRYYRQRILKDVVDQPTTHTDFGTLVHSYIEHSLDAWGSTGTDDLRMKAQAASDMLDVNTKAIADKYIAAIKAIVRMQKLKCLTEQKLSVDMALNPVEFSSPKAWLRAIIDVLLISANGRVAFIYDWKTGKRRPDKLQLTICAALVFNYFDHIDRIRAGFVWLKKDVDAADTFKYERKDLPDMWNEILQKTKRIEAARIADVWQPIPSGLCKWCPAASTCDFAQL